jgi:hypothetical protein
MKMEDMEGRFVSQIGSKHEFFPGQQRWQRRDSTF